jgi:hypothetical protein
MNKALTRWQRNPILNRGVICGTDAQQEWLLPWWWSRLRDYNDHPVAFCDFGMSSEAREWCRERGSVIPITFNVSLVASKEEVAFELVEKWEHCYTSTVWDFRHVWFQKPFALLQSPFQRSLWLDLDCEVLGSLDPLFEMCTEESQIGIMREFNLTHLPRYHPEALYNSGVIVCVHGAPLIEKWAEGALSQTHQFWGDEVLLSHLINQMGVPVVEIPGIFNWRVSQGININAIICHWVGGGGKTFIQQYGGFKPTLERFQQAFIRQSATK